MSPVEKLIRIIDKDLCYGISELQMKCELCGINFTRMKIYYDIKKEKLQSFQIGNKADHQIKGSFFLEYIITNIKNNTNITN